VIFRRFSIQLLLLVSLPLAAGAAGTQRHFIFDLNKVLIDDVSEKEAAEKHIQGLHLDGRVYFKVPGADEILSDLAHLPDADIMIYTAAPKPKADKLLALLKVKKGPNEFLDVSQVAKIAYDDQVENPNRYTEDAKAKIQPELPPFRDGKKKKDLTKLVPAEDLPNTVLFDDRTGNVVRGQEKSLLWIKPLGEQKNNPRSVESTLSTYRLSRARALLQRAMDASEKNHGSLTDALFKLQWDREPDRYIYKASSFLDPSLYQDGDKLLGLQHSQVQELAQTQLLPRSDQFQTDHDKVKDLFFVRNFIPDLFSQGATFDFSPLRIVDGEAQLLSDLERLPAYQAALTQKQNYKSITFTDPNHYVKVLNGRTIDAQKYQDFEKAVQALYTEVAGSNDPKQEIIKLVRDRTATMKGLQSREVSSGLISLLPPSQRTAAYKMSKLEDRLALLNDLPNQVLPDKLLKTDGWPAGFTLKEGISEVRKLSEQEKEIGILATARALINDSETSEGARERLLNLDAASVSSVLDPEGLKASMKTFYDQARAKGSPYRSEAFMSWVNSFTDPFAIAFKNETDRRSLSLTMVQVPPNVADFRGCPAGNCSTAREFSIPHDPNERVFFVYDGEPPVLNRKAIGIVEGTLLEEGGKRSFYLNTIQGSRMDRHQASLLLSGISRLKDELNVSSILLPDPRRLPNMINNKVVLSEIRQSIDKKYLEPLEDEKNMDVEAYEKLLLPITYRNPEVREAVENFKHENNKATYDRMSENRFAVPLERKDLEREVQIHIQQQQMPEAKIPDLSYPDEVGIALDLQFSGRPKDLKRMAKDLKIDLASIDPLFKSVGNAKKLPCAEYVADVTATLQKLSLPADLLSERQTLIRRGWLQSPDAMSAENKAKTIDYFSQEMLNKAVYPETLLFSRAHWDDLIQAPEVQRTTAAVLKDTEENLYNLMQILPVKRGAIPESMRDKVLSRLYDPVAGTMPLRLLPYLDDKLSENEVESIVVKALRGSNASLAGEAGSVLFKFLPRSTYVMQEIKRAVIDPAVPLGARQTMIAKLAKISPADAKSAIVEIFKRADSLTERQLFAQVCGNVKDPELAHLARLAYLRELPNPKTAQTIQELNDGVKIRKILLPSLMAQADEDPTVKSLIVSVASDPDPSIRRQLALTLVEAGGNDPEWLPHAYHLKNDPDRDVRQALGNQLGARVPANADAQQILLELSSDPDPEVRNTARFRLSSIISSGLIPAERSVKLQVEMDHIIEFGQLSAEAQALCVRNSLSKSLALPEAIPRK